MHVVPMNYESVECKQESIVALWQNLSVPLAPFAQPGSPIPDSLALGAR